MQYTQKIVIIQQPMDAETQPIPEKKYISVCSGHYNEFFIQSTRVLLAMESISEIASIYHFVVFVYSSIYMLRREM